MADPAPPERPRATGRRVFALVSTVVWLTALACVVESSVDHMSAPSWGNPIGDTRSAEVAGGTRVGQQFTAPFPGLHRIEVSLDRLTVRSAHRVTFHLQTTPSASEALWTSDFSTDEVQDGIPNGFEFPRIDDSKGQAYYFYLESLASASGDAIAVRYGPKAILQNATAYLNGEPVAGNLQFQTFYALGTWDKIDLLLTQLAEGRPYMLGTRGFYVGLAVTYLIILGLLLRQAAKVVVGSE